MKGILVVSNKNGTARIKPFDDYKNHAGEAYWIHGKLFKVGSDNRIKFSDKFMEKHGFLRSDGKRGLILQPGLRWLTSSEFPEAKRKKFKQTRKSYNDTYFVNGANILNGKEYEKYYSGHTGDRVDLDPVEYDENGGIKLRQENTVDVYQG